MELNENAVRQALARVPYPGFSRDILSFGIVKSIGIDAGRISVRLDLAGGDASVAPALRETVVRALSALPGAESVDVRVVTGAPDDGLAMAGHPSRPEPSSAAAGGIEHGLVPGVRHIVAVASGKGGVGKSTVAVNLAIALARLGARVGLLDADVYGPSIPVMLGKHGQPQFDAGQRKARPFEGHGIRFMSLGFIAPAEEALIWRGPMVMKAIDELLRNVDWGDLDVLIVDLPPGTGDAQLTLSQKVRMAGAVIVTTPQDVALADAIKGITMFRKVGVPILGLVENMSFFACPHCGERTEVFGHGGGRREAERQGVAFLGEIPLDPAIRDGSDAGKPIVAEKPESDQARAIATIAEQVARALEIAPSRDAAQGASESGGGWFGRIRRGRTRGPAS